MANTVNDLMNAVAAFLGRDRSNFYKNGRDCLLQACNNARLYAERVVDFELSRLSVDVPNVSLTDGGSLDNAVDHTDGITPVSVKKIKKAFIQLPGNTGSYPIAFYSRDKWLRRVQRKVERLTPLDLSFFLPNPVNWTMESLMGSVRQFAVIQSGRTVLLVPADTTTWPGGTLTLYFDVLKWLPAYGTTARTGSATSTSASHLVASAATFITWAIQVGMVVRNTTDSTQAMVTAVNSQNDLTLSSDIFISGEAYSITTAAETDFLLDSCFDWLMYRTIWELNYFLKEDERVQLSTDLIRDAWEALKAWNENLISQSVDDVDLD